MFEVFTFSKVQGKLVISSELHEEYINTIINRFDEFVDCRYIHQKIQAISKLDKYVDFNKGTAKEVLIKVYDNYGIDYSEEYVNLLIKYKNILTSELDITGTLTILLDNTGNYYEVLNLVKLYSSYEEELKRIVEDNDKVKIVKELVSDITQNLADEYDYEEIIEFLQELSKLFQWNLSSEMDEISDTYHEILKSTQQELDYDDDFDNYRDNSFEPRNEDDYVEDLFESLFYQ